MESQQIKQSVATIEDLMVYLEDHRDQIDAEYTRKMEVLNKQIKAANTTVELLKKRAKETQ